MSDQSGSSSLRVLFELALQDYETQTGTNLIRHPLAEQLERCDTVEAVISVLREQAGAFSEFRGSDGKFMRSLERSVSVLYTLSASTTLSEGIGLVCRTALVVFHIYKPHSTAIPTCKSVVCWPFHFARCMCLYFLRVYSCDIRIYQAVEDVKASYDALVDLLESIEHFLNRLSIYTNIPLTGPLAEIIIKIMVELLSTLSLVTKEVKQRRPSGYIVTDTPLRC
jgi:hypothetical protein